MTGHCGVFRQAEEVILSLLYEDGPGNLVEWEPMGGQERKHQVHRRLLVSSIWSGWHSRDDKQKWTELKSHLESKRKDLQRGEGSGDWGSEQA